MTPENTESASSLASLAASLRPSRFESALPLLSSLGLGLAVGGTFGWVEAGAAFGLISSLQIVARSGEARRRQELVGGLGNLFSNAEPAELRTPKEVERESHDVESPATPEPVSKAHAERVRDLEQRLEVSENLRRAKSGLLAELAPEMTGALRGISRVAERLSDTDLTLEQRDYVDTVQSASSTLNSLLGDILDLARIDAGRLKLRRRELQLAALLDGIAEELYPLAWKKGIELSIDIAPEMTEWVWGDGRRITQLLRHIVRGSIQSTDRGEVQLKVVPAIPTEPGSGPVRFEIHDTAPVHTQAELARLLAESPSSLESLAELDLSLGLLLARGLVDVMGGNMGAHAKGNGGNLFWFELPLEATQGPGSDLDSSFNAMVGTKLLVVDARQGARETLVAATERLGLIVHEAESADGALDTLLESIEDAEPFDVVLVDDDLQGGVGRELAEKIARDDKYGKPSLILLTASGRAQNPARLAELGIDAWIPKPVRVQRLQEALLYVCDGSSAHSEAQFDAEATTDSPASPRILLLEEEPSCSRVLVALFARLGCRTEVLADSARLAEVYQDGVYDAVVVDAAVGDQTRRRAISELRSVQPKNGDRARLIALIDSSDDTHLNAWSEAGADCCLLRPRNPNGMQAAFRQLFGGSPLLPLYPEIDDTEPAMHGNEEKITLDPDVIESLKELGGEDDPGLFGELVDMFLSDTPERISALQQALEANDTKTIERVAHSMKSSCGNLGAMVLADLCLQIELACRRGEVDNVAPLVVESNGEYERVKSALQNELA